MTLPAQSRLTPAPSVHVHVVATVVPCLYIPLVQYYVVPQAQGQRAALKRRVGGWVLDSMAGGRGFPLTCRHYCYAAIVRRACGRHPPLAGVVSRADSRRSSACRA